jgi:hypothetical protein
VIEILRAIVTVYGGRLAYERTANGGGGLAGPDGGDGTNAGGSTGIFGKGGTGGNGGGAGYGNGWVLAAVVAAVGLLG